jgi:hypothetical protein
MPVTTNCRQDVSINPDFRIGRNASFAIGPILDVQAVHTMAFIGHVVLNLRWQPVEYVIGEVDRA